jgi:hypothetical protein
MVQVIKMRLIDFLVVLKMSGCAVYVSSMESIISMDEWLTRNCDQ